MLLIIDNLGYLRNHVAAALHLHPIANFHAQPFDLVHVMQRGVSHRCASDQNRRQHRDWREFASAPHLNANVFQLCNPRSRCIFISNRPARSLARESEFILQRGTIHFQDDAVNLIRQRLALFFPLPNECPRLVDRHAPACDSD